MDTAQNSGNNVSSPETTEPGISTAPEVNQPPQPSQPNENIPPIENPETPPQDLKPKKSRLLPKVLTLLTLILVLTFAAGTYAVAYEKVKLTKYPEFQRTVSHMVISIPFLPKTPKYLIEKTVLAHQAVTKQSFDISLVINSNELSSLLGLNSLDFQVKGSLDYSDPNDIVFNLNTFLSKDFNMDLKKKDAFLYFKINKLPSFLFSALGISQENLDPLLNKWVSYDTTPLDTEARKQMQQMQDKEINPLSKDFNNLTDEYIDSKVLENVKLEKVQEDGSKLYKLTLDADPGLIDYIGNKVQEENQRSGFYDKESQSTPKLSDTLKTLKWEMFIDQKQFFTKKVVVNMKLEYDGTSNGINSYLGAPSLSPNLDKKTEIITTFAAKFDDFGKSISVETPQSSITFEEFTDIISGITRSIYTSPAPEGSGASRNIKRLSDIQSISNSLELYMVECQKYPDNLEKLTGVDGACSGPYFVELPEDPIGIDYYYQASQDGKKYDLCAFLEETPDTQNTCPNLIYNYHVTNP